MLQVQTPLPIGLHAAHACIACMRVWPLKVGTRPRCALVSMISLCAATSSSVFGRYFSTQGASRPSTVASVRRRELLGASAMATSSAAIPATSCAAAIVTAVGVPRPPAALSGAGRAAGALGLLTLVICQVMLSAA